ncbi:MAG TPA: MBL fold metallo-hydrolase [Gammaproteobacteria bacterium]|nr:MBL fold metallo-hydrolase [Gammaproteobacteria bacterium]
MPTSRRLHRRRLLQAGALTLGAALLPRIRVRAQSAPDIKNTKLGDLALLEVGGVNVLALRGTGGALMVDGGPKASADALLKAVYAATGNDKVSTLILTHGHPEQTGATELVARAGGTILATEKTKIFLSHPVRSVLYEKTLEPLPEAARPTKTVRADGSLDVAGHKVEYGYLPAAHTDGDLFVHFRDQNVLAAGGVVAADRWPLLDWKNGAWFGGRVRALERLATLVKPDTRVVPAEGRLMTGRDVAHLRDIYDTLFKTMIDYMNMGLGAEDVTVRNPLKPYEAEFGDATAFLDGAYRSMQIAYVPD